MCRLQDLCYSYWNHPAWSVSDENSFNELGIRPVHRDVYDGVHLAIEVNPSENFPDLAEDVELGEQSDAREFLGYLIREQVRSKASPADAVSFDVVLEVETQSSWTCQDCGETKIDRSKTMQLGLYVPLNQEGPEGDDSLEWYLQSDFETSMNCRCHGAACQAILHSSEESLEGPLRKVTTTITRAPEILFIQFGRSDNYGDKIFSEVDYPEFLNLNEHREPGVVDEDCFYRLDAVVAHKGASIGGGHYVAAVRKHFEEGFEVVDGADAIEASWGGGFEEMLKPTTRERKGEAFVLMYSKMPQI